MHYDIDIGDFFLKPSKLESKFKGSCACKENHPLHRGKICRVIVERNCVPSGGYYMCFDCKHLNRNKREKAYARERRGQPKSAPRKYTPVPVPEITIGPADTSAWETKESLKNPLYKRLRRKNNDL